MLKIIIFDLSGVLFTNGLKIGVEIIHQKYKLNKDDLVELLNGQNSEDYRTGKQSSKDFWQNIQDQLFLTDVEVEDIRNSWFDSYQIIPEMVEMLKKLKHLGVELYYLSDNPEDRAKFLDQKYGFIELFDGGVFSFQAQSRKPSKKIFEYLLKQIDYSIDQILYLDDKESNLKPATELGLQTYLFESNDGFAEYLEMKYKIYVT